MMSRADRRTACASNGSTHGASSAERVHGNFTVVETDFKVVGKTILDLMRGDGGRLVFGVWDGVEVSQRSEYRIENEVFIPPRDDYSRIPLPMSTAEYISVKDLSAEIAACIDSHIDIELNDLWLLTAFVLSTWIADRWDRTAYLSITGPLGSGKTKMLTLLHRLCRRGILMGDATVAAIANISRCNPTILLDEIEESGKSATRDLRRLLRNGTTRDLCSYRAGQIHSIFGPKVLCSRAPLMDSALASRALHVAMSVTQSPKQPLNIKRLDWIERWFQPRLLKFRFDYFRKAIPWKSFPDLTPRMQDLAVCLAGALFELPELEEIVINGLTEKDEAMRIERGDEPEWLVLTALFQRYHRWAHHVTVGQLTEDVNAELERQHSGKKFNARGIGAVLRGIGFCTKKLGRLGYGVDWSSSNTEKLHKLVVAYDVRATATGLESSCSSCKKHGITVVNAI